MVRIVFVVSQHRAIFVQIDQIIPGKRRDFPAAAGASMTKCGTAMPLVCPCKALMIRRPVSTDVRKWFVPFVRSA